MKSVRLTQKYRGKLPGVVLHLDPKHAQRLVRSGFAAEIAAGDLAAGPKRPQRAKATKKK